MGKSPSGPNLEKEGYEAPPVADAAAETDKLLSNEGHEEDGERGWDGHLFQCFGRCDSHGCSSCGLVYCLPCLAFGLNMRRGLVLSAVKQALIFAVLVGLTWSLRAAHTAAMVADCPPPFPPDGPPPHGPPHGHLPRPFGPHFFRDLFAPDDARHPPFDPRDDPRNFRADAAVSDLAATSYLDTRFDRPIDGPDSPIGAVGGARHKPCKHKRGHKVGEHEHEHEHHHHHHEHEHEHHHHHEHEHEHKDVKHEQGAEESHDHHHVDHHNKEGMHADTDAAGAIAVNPAAALAAHSAATALPLRVTSAVGALTTAAEAASATVTRAAEAVTVQPATDAGAVEAALVSMSTGGVAVQSVTMKDRELPLLDDIKEWVDHLHEDEHQYHHEHRHGPHGHHHHHPGMEKCEALHATMSHISLALVLYSIGLSVYAARRRTELREHFNIAGSKLGDFVAWIFCPSCALCQETRTLAANNVEAGVWRGRTPTHAVQYAALEAVAPPVHDMAMPDDLAKPAKV